MELLFHYDMVQKFKGKQSFGWLNAQNVEWRLQVHSKNRRIAIPGRRCRMAIPTSPSNGPFFLLQKYPFLD
ncbi:hypothetical protein PVK06_006871 [Gossypium arboreum]|uniref:Uncharacterized protein n=1 Tax=Gossypium arboreum TaxID=29729 RepID=A0ABR0QGG6_GOSAR|nr:hypothetical protein PVK06_006871 [Gossypium arboreum]